MSAPIPAPSCRCSKNATDGATACGSPTWRPAPGAGGARTPTSTPLTASTLGSKTPIRTGKDTGLGRFPSHSLAINTAWLSAALIAATLLAWLRLLALDGELARAEPKTLRYRLLHTAGRLVRGARRQRLKITRTWPWASALAIAWQRISALPQAP